MRPSPYPLHIPARGTTIPRVLVPIAAVSVLGLATGAGTAIFEVLFVAVVAWQLLRHPLVHGRSVLLAFLAASYIVLGYLHARPNSVGELKDFAINYKFFYYLAALPLLTAAPSMRYLTGERIFKFFVWLFVFVYTAKRVAGVERPTVFIENNFELIPLILAAVALRARGSGAPGRFYWGTLLFICAISGSRSSLVAVVFVLATMIDVRPTRKSLFQVVGLGVASLLVLAVLIQRLGNKEIGDIDRVRFLMVFLYEVRSWGLLQWLIGSPAMTPLTPGSCAALSFYEILMSQTENGSCYSVILHSFVLRALFDHGVTGLLFALYIVAYCLRKRGYGRKDRFMAMGVILATGLSVSSLNNVYTTFGVMFLMFLAPAGAAARNLQSWGDTAAGMNPRSENGRGLAGASTDA